MKKISTSPAPVILITCIITMQSLMGQTTPDTLSAASLKKLGDDIRNSGVKTLPEALKLAANLQAAQVNSSQRAISARGFDKLQASTPLRSIERSIYGKIAVRF